MYFLRVYTKCQQVENRADAAARTHENGCAEDNFQQLQRLDRPREEDFTGTFRHLLTDIDTFPALPAFPVSPSLPIFFKTKKKNNALDKQYDSQ